MEGMNLKNVAKQLRDAGIDPEDLEKAMDYFQKKKDESGAVTFNSPVRNIKGLTVPVLLRTIEEKKNEGNGKMRYEYRLMVCTFEDVVVPSEIGEKLSDNVIRLRLDKRVLMTEDRRREYLASLKPAERNGLMGNRKYDIIRDSSVLLFAGTEIKIMSFEGPFTHSNNMPFVPGEFAICKGLMCEETFEALGLASKFGKQWKVQDKHGKLEEDANKGPEDIKRMLVTLSNENHLINVGDNNPNFSMDNESSVDTAFRKDKEGSGKELKNWEKDQILLGFLPEEIDGVDVRGGAKRVIVVPLHGTEATPEFMAQRKKVIIKEPTWSIEFSGTKNDGTPVKLGAFQAECLIMNGEEEIRCVIQFQLFDKHMTRFGVMNYDVFSKIAGSFVPHCRGYIAGRMDVGSSHAMDESSTVHNKKNDDGTNPMGVGFGVFAYGELLEIDLASGVVSGGFGPLTPDCAKAAMKLKYKFDDFSEQCPADVASYATLNPLNTGGKPPIVNLFESRHSIDEMAKSHQFFMVCEKRNDSEEVKELIEKLQRKYSDSIVQRMSELIQGQAVKGITGWPVKLNSQLVYTIFAIRNSLVESTMKILDGGNKMPEKDFVEAYVTAMKKRKASEDRAQLILDEVKALEDLDPEEFEDPPAKKQKIVEPPQEDPPAKKRKKIVEPPQEEESEQSAPADEDEEEPSTLRRPRRARNPKRKKKAPADDIL